VRINVSGDHPAVAGIIEYFAHPNVRVKPRSTLPDCRVVVLASKGATIPEISCGDPSMQALLISQLAELGVVRVMVATLSSVTGRTMRVTLPMAGGFTEENEVAWERAIFRTVMLTMGRRDSLRDRIFALAMRIKKRIALP
jgi:hypothetical protein